VPCFKFGITSDTELEQAVVVRSRDSGRCRTARSRSAAWPTTPHASSAHEAIEGAERIVAAAVADMLGCGEAPPPSLTDRRYSGNFVVRTSPQLHARLVVEANEQSVSLNQWAVQKLANRPLRIDDLF
jgi:predicted HicB family RNase H-like nuclease